MHYPTLFLPALLSIQAVSAQQAVCGGLCANYGTDGIGRALCPGTSFWSRFSHPSGSCKSHHELLGGYGCCCECTTTPSIDQNKLPCTFTFTHVEAYNHLHEIVSKGSDYGICTSTNQKDLGTLADCQGRASVAVHKNNAKYPSSGAFDFHSVNFVDAKLGYVAMIGVGETALANEGHEYHSRCNCGFTDIKNERECNCKYTSSVTIRRKNCLKGNHLYQAKCLMTEDNACDGAYNSTVEFQAA